MITKNEILIEARFPKTAMGQDEVPSPEEARYMWEGVKRVGRYVARKLREYAIGARDR